MPETQTYANHTRRAPMFLAIALLLLLNLIFAIYATVHAWPGFRHTHLWWIVMSIVFPVMAGLARSSAIRVQDRLIRLEERLRLAALMPADLALVQALSIPQLVALRFASDAEVPALARRAAAEGLTPKQIKESVVSWQPDTFRV